MARVEWTARAAAMLKTREYRHLSPTFFHAPDGTVSRIEGAALTNYLTLVLLALASSGLAGGPPASRRGPHERDRVVLVDAEARLHRHVPPHEPRAPTSLAVYPAD